MAEERALFQTAELDREWRESLARLRDILGSEVRVAPIPGVIVGPMLQPLPPGPLSSLFTNPSQIDRCA